MPNDDPVLEQLRATLSSLARRPAPRVRTRTLVRSSPATIHRQMVRFAPEEETLLAAGMGSLSATNLDLATLLPVGCNCAYIRFSASGGADGDAVTISVRPEPTGSWTVPLRLIALQGSADTASNDNSEWVRLGPDAGLELEVSSIGSPNWSLILLGYC